MYKDLGGVALGSLDSQSTIINAFRSYVVPQPEHPDADLSIARVRSK